MLIPFSKGFSNSTYDVFLSFRGKDTRYGFTGNLYHALNQRGINTFMDDEMIKRGEQISPTIFKAIEQSRTAIIVFSKTYASSKWCLQELVKIIACYKGKELVVLPVFYKVDPSEVRQQTGSYGRQLAMHEEKMMDNEKELQSWRLALREAANLAGWPFRDGSEYEYEFIKRIADTVGSTSKQNLSYVEDYAVGLESRVSKIIPRLQMPDPNVIMIGICGVGGIGKTTLARALYNSISQEFEGLCFLYDVRENSTKYGLAYLQQVILSDVVGENIKLRNENEGIPILIRKLQDKRVLLILDDVDKLDQLKNLAGACCWFGWGSRIVITTRHKDILAAHGVGNIYDVPRFDYYEALQLLSFIASKRPTPDGVWNRAIHYSNGLPLVLKVIGSDLLEKSTDEWEVSLDRYAQVCNQETQSILEVSYDSLNECERRIFLDIACFFNGEPLPYVEEILSACGFYTKYGIERLKDRSLLSITPSGNLMMHDHIIDIAMKIVQQESPIYPCKRSRLWLPEDVLQVLDENSGNDKIEVMILDNLPRGHLENLSDKIFKEMKSLRILIIKDAIYSEVLQHLPNSLRVLDWSGYPSWCLPLDFVNLPSNCLILNQFKNMKCLMRMDFTYCNFIREVPDLSGVPNLIKLYLDNCINVTKIHDSVGLLGNLKELTATRCTNLKTIPVAFKLSSLRVLSFSECSRLARFPEILCKIENLAHVNLWQTAIEELPFSIGNVTGLVVLTLMDCARLDKLPSSIFTLPRLQEIQADSCKGFGISIECEDNNKLLSFTVCPNKIHLYLSSCSLTDEHLFICLSGFANVVHLDISYNNFTVLPQCIKECIHLNTLLLTNCNQLQEISVIPSKLKDIDSLNCTSLTSQSQCVLLSQAFHETGEKSVMLPGSSIPEWFDHCSNERSITFYARERFPSICVCVVFGMLENLPHHFVVRFCLNINGHKMILSPCSSLSIVKEHVWLFDLSTLIYNNHFLRETFEKHGCWNHVEVSCEDCQDEHLMAHGVHGARRITIVKWYGIHVYRQENIMNDVLFTSVNTMETFSQQSLNDISNNEVMQI